MLDAETRLRNQIDRDEECPSAAGQILSMRIVMTGLIRERADLGDTELESTFAPPSPLPLPPPAAEVAHPRKRRLQAPPKRRFQRAY